MEGFDLYLYLSIFSAFIVIGLVFFVFKRQKRPFNEDAPLPGATARMNAIIANRNNARARMRAARTGRTSGRSGQDTDAGNEEDESGDDQSSAPSIDIGDKKVGTKKMAKLEAKAAKKAQREKEIQERAEKKKQEEKDEEEKKKQQLKEEEEERKREEEERKLREEKEKREQEEYLKLKEAFSIEEEGYDENQDEDESNLLERFIAHIQQNKVVVMEDLAAVFRMKTQSVINRINELQKTGALTGVIDDRGKFIYISQEELNSVSTFIKQRGRVSVSELVENSNQLITLVPDQVEVGST